MKARIINEFLQWQNRPYDFSGDQGLQWLLHQMPTMTEDELWNTSQVVEPRSASLQELD